MAADGAGRAKRAKRAKPAEPAKRAIIRNGARSPASPDRARMAAAIAELLDAAGHDVARDPELRGTPARVADALCDAFLDGYTETPREVLAERYADEGGEPIVVRDIAFHALCPHHLLPMTGLAHVAYVPANEIVGFSRLVRLVDCFAHRLVLQERIARDVARALVDVLGARAAVCALDAEQGCMTLRGVRRVGSRVWVEAAAGDTKLAARLRQLVGRP